MGTRITSLPYTISSPGFYFLGKDLSTTGNGITVETDNVTIDLMGFSITGDGATGLGIHISGRSNVEIRNGTVRNFGSGIYSVATGDNCRIINIRALNNAANGIKLVGRNHLVEKCNASGNGTRGIWAYGYYYMLKGNVCSGNSSSGIDCTAGGNLLDNVVYGNGAYGFNLSTSGTTYYVIDRNTLYNNGGGNFNAVPPQATFGVNAGIP